MAILKLNETFAKAFVSGEEVSAVAADVKAAYATVAKKDGAGNDFLGWVDLPVNYDKEEFDRILVASEKIKKSCDILVVIGIGGSYLGAEGHPRRLFCR